MNVPLGGDGHDHEHGGRDGDVAHRPQDVGEEEEEPLGLAVGHRHARRHYDEEDDLETGQAS